MSDQAKKEPGPPGKISGIKRWLGWGGALLTILTAVGAGFVCLRPSGDPAAALTTTAVVRGAIENAVSAIGTLQPIRSVDIGAQVSGQLKTLHVLVGDKVSQGQLLAEIDPRILAAKVTEAEATLDNLWAMSKVRKAQLLLHEQEHDRNLKLLADDAVARSEADSSAAALAATRAEIEAIAAQIRQAEAALATTHTNLGYTRITAPMAGTVVEVAAKEGQTLNANQQTPLVLRIAELERMTVWAQVSEADVHQMRGGLPAYFTLLGQPERRWTGAVRQILPTPQEINGVKFYSVLFEVDNPDRGLLPQMTAQVFIVLEQAENALLVPVSAVTAGERQKGGDAGQKRGEGGGQKRGAGGGAGKPGKKSAISHTITLLEADGAMEVRPVTIGISNAFQTEIVSGVSKGETVVTGQRSAQSGQGKGGGKKKGALQ